MILGITGGTGCGKTTLLRMIGEMGGLVLDCDAIYHRLLSTDPELLQKIEKRFPESVKDGILQREFLGNLVFSDASALKDLNRITHQAVKEDILRALEDAPALTAIDAIGLFEAELDRLCDVTVAVIAPREMRIRRLMERDGISRAYAEKRIDAQRSNEDFRSICDYSLENTGSQGEFQAKCLAFFRDLAIIKE